LNLQNTLFPMRRSRLTPKTQGHGQAAPLPIP
jgi:hypothetical protein